MREIEILFELHTDIEQAKSALKKFHYKGTKQTKDIYYADPLRKHMYLNEDDRLVECCRLREKGDKAYITYKINHYDNGIWIFCDEYETEVKDIKVMEKIFECLGLEKLVVINNVKHLYETPNYEIALEEVTGLGCFLEIEALHDDKNSSAEEIKSEIYKFAKNLGPIVGKELNSGKPELLLQKKRQIE